MQHNDGSASPSSGADPRFDRRPGPTAGAHDLDPRSEQVRVELDRIERRWSALPLARAEAALPHLREVLDHLTDAAGQPPVADLGPATALHQLKVLVWEAARSSRAPERVTEGALRSTTEAENEDLAARLTDLRRALP